MEYKGLIDVCGIYICSTNSGDIFRVHIEQKGEYT